MFKELSNYDTRRTPFQALVFYIGWTVILVALVAIPLLTVLTQFGMEKERGAAIGSLIALVVGEYLVAKIIRAKSLEGPYIFAYLAQALFCIPGIWLGMLIPAVLTTVKDQTDLTKEVKIHKERL